MATQTGELVSARGMSNRGRMPYFVQSSINLATATTEKGSALAAGDIFEAISVPANTLVLQAGMQYDTALDSSAAGVTFNLGFSDTHGAVDTFVAVHDGDAATAGDYATPTDDSNILVETADTIDLELQAISTTPVSGIIRIFAVMMDCSDTGSLAPVDVDRDTLA
tara:strand:+ start:69 stop:566 length:498 start_codon:yes stop_codon:yes gene_type:complete